MKKYIRRFVDWMEGGPTYLTIWFMPLLFTIGLIAAITNRITRKDIVTR